jgi:hypothetical protein
MAFEVSFFSTLAFPGAGACFSVAAGAAGFACPWAMTLPVKAIVVNIPTKKIRIFFISAYLLLFLSLSIFGLNPAFCSALNIRNGHNEKMTERLQIGNVGGKRKNKVGVKVNAEEKMEE